YLEVVRNKRIIPIYIKSDRGSEITIVTNAYYYLSNTSKEYRLIKPRRYAFRRLK
ncbi:hypothetical protein QBC39DRAFT_261849, partial [Podospora conica]